MRPRGAGGRWPVVDSARCPVPGCGKPVAVYVKAGRAYPQRSTLVARHSAGFRFRSCADHEAELMNGLGDALDWATITRPGPPRTVTVGKKVPTCLSRP